MMRVESYSDYDEKTRSSSVYDDGTGGQITLIKGNGRSHAYLEKDYSNIENMIRLLNMNHQTSTRASSSHKIFQENKAQNRKVHEVASPIIKPMNTQASGEVKIEASWGDKDGSKISVGAAGKVSDDRGNYVKAEIKQDNDGKGSASVSAGAKTGK